MPAVGSSGHALPWHCKMHRKQAACLPACLPPRGAPSPSLPGGPWSSSFPPNRRPPLARLTRRPHGPAAAGMLSLSAPPGRQAHPSCKASSPTTASCCCNRIPRSPGKVRRKDLPACLERAPENVPTAESIKEQSKAATRCMALVWRGLRPSVRPCSLPVCLSSGRTAAQAAITSRSPAAWWWRGRKALPLPGLVSSSGRQTRMMTLLAAAALCLPAAFWSFYRIGWFAGAPRRQAPPTAPPPAPLDAQKEGGGGSRALGLRIKARAGPKREPARRAAGCVELDRAKVPQGPACCLCAIITNSARLHAEAGAGQLNHNCTTTTTSNKRWE